MKGKTKIICLSIALLVIYIVNTFAIAQTVTEVAEEEIPYQCFNDQLDTNERLNAIARSVDKGNIEEITRRIRVADAINPLFANKFQREAFIENFRLVNEQKVKIEEIEYGELADQSSTETIVDVYDRAIEALEEANKERAFFDQKAYKKRLEKLRLKRDNAENDYNDARKEKEEATRAWEANPQDPKAIEDYKKATTKFLQLTDKKTAEKILDDIYSNYIKASDKVIDLEIKEEFKGEEVDEATLTKLKQELQHHTELLEIAKGVVKAKTEEAKARERYKDTVARIEDSELNEEDQTTQIRSAQKQYEADTIRANQYTAFYIKEEDGKKKIQVMQEDGQSKWMTIEEARELLSSTKSWYTKQRFSALRFYYSDGDREASQNHIKYLEQLISDYGRADALGLLFKDKHEFQNYQAQLYYADKLEDEAKGRTTINPAERVMLETTRAAILGIYDRKIAGLTASTWVAGGDEESLRRAREQHGELFLTLNSINPFGTVKDATNRFVEGGIVGGTRISDLEWEKERINAFFDYITERMQKEGKTLAQVLAEIKKDPIHKEYHTVAGIIYGDEVKDWIDESGNFQALMDHATGTDEEERTRLNEQAEEIENEVSDLYSRLGDGLSGLSEEEREIVISNVQNYISGKRKTCGPDIEVKLESAIK